jgi:hypothetical protein
MDPISPRMMYVDPLSPRKIIAKAEFFSIISETNFNQTWYTSSLGKG